MIGQGLQINHKNSENLINSGDSMKDIESTTEEELITDECKKDEKRWARFQTFYFILLYTLEWHY